MHEHGPNCLEGPIRGTNAWWRGLDPPAEKSSPPEKTPAKKKNLKEMAGIRKDLVERIRAEIAAGNYDTPEKWDAALDRLLERLQGD